MTAEEFTPDVLAGKTHSAPVVFTKLMLLIDRYGQDAVYCFVEGYDMPYYMSPIRFALRKDPIEIPCGGKNNVLLANQDIESKSEYTHYIKRYFVDRDYTNNDSIPNTVFITDGYSIENYYLRDSCVSRILKNEFKIDEVEHKKNYQLCMDLFHEQHKKYIEGILLFNAWYCCLLEDDS